MKILAVAFSLTMLVACGKKEIKTPNPASVKCIKDGGTLIPENTANGQTYNCKFADGSQCEEWAYYRGECKPGTVPEPPTGL